MPDENQKSNGITRARSRKADKGNGSLSRKQSEVVCEAGFAEYGTNKFVPLDMTPKAPEFLHCKSSQKWSEFAFRIRRLEQLQNLRSTIRRISNDLPEKIEKIYAECEESTTIALDAESKKRFYREFSRMAQGFAVLQYWEVEMLIGQLELSSTSDEDLLERITSEKIHQSSEAGKPIGVFDFRRFLYLLVEVVQNTHCALRCTICTPVTDHTIRAQVIRELQEIGEAKPPAFSLEATPRITHCRVTFSYRNSGS